ncbi:DNA polymerase III subunit delta [Haloplasma contractile]|uniref:DNA polymerase III subunit delta n=1 Tax=Haloplasma contractile SSD-17B TaxID=1033810 RepID=U2FLW9_9MOLU|nr:DNA polymerase III subunit delta [Haloplasma contractile]ERJ13735.1 DNA polymerase III protein [Haloplasma contractile SSD-17B]
MNHVIILTGENKFAIDAEINKLIKKYKVDELSLSKFDSEESTIDEILNDCETLPFLVDQKLVLINNPVFLSTSKSGLMHNTDRFINYLENPNKTTVLVINACLVKLDGRSKAVKALKKHAKFINKSNLEDYEARRIIKDRLSESNVSIDRDAIGELIARTECDAFKLNSELEKLSFYSETGTTITVDDVRILIAEPMESNVFNLTNSILERNTSDAVKRYKKLLVMNEEPILFAAILAKNFHNLYLIKQFQISRYTENQIKQYLKIHPYQLKKLYQIALRTEIEQITDHINHLQEYDFQVKSGQIDKNLGFELYILRA